MFLFHKKMQFFVYLSLQDIDIYSDIDNNITAEKLKQMEKELQDEAAKKNAAIKVIWVVEFSWEGTKIREIQYPQKKIIFFLSIGMVSTCQKVPTSDFQS